MADTLNNKMNGHKISPEWGERGPQLPSTENKTLNQAEGWRFPQKVQEKAWSLQGSPNIDENMYVEGLGARGLVGKEPDTYAPPRPSQGTWRFQT